MINMDKGNYKQNLMHVIEKQKNELVAISDYIFDNPEIGFQEVKASKILCEYLNKNGFEVELGYAGLDTAFRAIYRSGEGGPNIGLLCEYDALENLGHGCAHHLQGPSVLGSAVAIKEILGEFSYALEIIGTPAEETSVGGKTIMLDNGAFKHLDVILMMHGGDATITDIRSQALSEFKVIYSGKSAHSGIAPEKGRSALEALMLVFNGIAYLRGHIIEDVRIHGIIENGGQVVNAIPDKAVGHFEFRSYSRPYLNNVIERAMKIFEGAALMTETSYEVEKITDFHNKIPVLTLNNTLMENAKVAEAKNTAPPREKTGATDFASVMYYVPGACIRVAFLEKGMSASHSQYWLDNGKTGDAHEAITVAAKIMALTVFDLITEEELLKSIQLEFKNEKAKSF